MGDLRHCILADMCPSNRDMQEAVPGGLWGSAVFKPDIDKLRARQDVAGLAKALSYKQPEIRREAARALGWLKNPSALVPLAAASQDADVAVRREAVQALGRLVHGFAENLGSEQPEIRQRVAHALAAASQDADVAVRRQAVGTLGRLGDPSGVEPLAKVLLHDADEDTRWSAALGMFWVGRAEGEARDKAVAALISALGDSSVKVREKSAEVLGSLPDPRSIEPLTQVRLGSSYRYAAASLIKLAAAFPDAVAEQALRALTSKDPHMRASAAMVLGRVGDRRAVTPLINALQDAADAVRMEAAEGLGKLGDPEAVDALMAAYAGAGGVAKLVPGLFPTFAEVIYSALAAIADPRSTDIFIEKFYRDAPDSIYRPHESLTLKALKRIPAPKAEMTVRLAEALMCVASEDPEKQALAIRELRQLGDAGVRPLAQELEILSSAFHSGTLSDEQYSKVHHTIDSIKEALQAIASPAAEHALSDTLEARVDAMYTTSGQRWNAFHDSASEEYKAVRRYGPTGLPRA